MKIEVRLSICCQPFLFNIGGEMVTHSHKESKWKITEWDSGGDVRLLEFPGNLPNNKVKAHLMLTEFLETLGQKNHGYDIGEFFDLEMAS